MSLPLNGSAHVPSRLATLLESVPAGTRGQLLMSLASFRPNPTLESSFEVGEFRAAFAEFWEHRLCILFQSGHFARRSIRLYPFGLSSNSTNSRLLAMRRTSNRT